MACATASLPWARYRTAALSAGIRCGAAAAASRGAATTAPAGSTGPATAAVRQRKAGGRRSCASPHFYCRTQATLAHHHARMQEQQQLGGRAAGGVGREQPVELAGLAANLVAMKRHARDIVARPSFRAARGDNAADFRFDELDPAGIGE